MFHSHHNFKTWPKPTSVPCEKKKDIYQVGRSLHMFSLKALYVSRRCIIPTYVFSLFLFCAFQDIVLTIWIVILDKIFTYYRFDSEIIHIFKVGISITADKTGTFPMQEQHR